MRPERRRELLIASLYHEGLGRAPETAGHVAWLDFVLRGGGCNAASLGSVIEGILTSPELEGQGLDVATRVTRLYRAGLGRNPEPAGRESSEAALNSGTSWASLVHGLATSAEAASYANARCSP